MVLIGAAALSGCGSLPFLGGQTLTIATVVPTTGVDAPLGQAMQRAVDLAVRQSAQIGGGYTLTATHIDEASVPIDQTAAALAADQTVMGIVGPFDSQTAVTMLPVVEAHGLATISPGATLPGLTQADQAAAEGIAFAQLHPKGTRAAFFRLPETDGVAGKVAADLAVAPAQSGGLAAQSVFVVDDGTLSGKALAAAFRQALAAGGGATAGQLSLATATPGSAQAVVTAIIRANPDLVYFAGNTAAGAELRTTLSLSGAPQLTILTSGPIADHPGWSAAVGVAPAAAFTTALLPEQDVSALAGARGFVAAYRATYPGQALLPESAVAYDAAMDEIAAMKALIKAGTPVTRAAVLAGVASARYPGVTGTVAFAANGDRAQPSGFSLYTCDTKGAWQYQTGLSG